ncbi:MAG: zf-HC2 domain-containing protein [Acidobacteriota bacterium]
MKHPEIDDQAVAENYVAGKLTPAEVAEFEEHYLNCPACIQAVEDAERLQRGLARAAAEDIATQQTILATVWRALRTGPGVALLLGLLVVGLLPAGLAWQRANDLGVDLETARQELADERRPRVNTPILSLAPTRAGEQPLQQISLLAEPEWIVLAIELGDTARPRYAAELIRIEGPQIWQSQDLEPSYRGTLTLSLHSSLLPPGNYLLSLEGDGQELSFPLRVVTL